MSMPARTAVHGLTVLYDADCKLCTFVRNWLSGQAQLVRLTFVPCGSPTARRRFPGLDHAATREEITAVGDRGQVYKGASAWVVCLWALAKYRPLAHRLASGAGAQAARAAVLVAARWPGATARWGGGAYGDGWRYDPASGWSRACPDGSCAAAD